MSDTVTREEMEATFAGQWLLVGHPEWDEELNLIRGEVLAHSADRDEIYRRLLSTKKPGDSLAIEYVGPIPDDAAVML